ncbi:MAG: helix-turn-helix domain-containing protein [Burkholderiales bacterium]|nr:helix-turn-helix domain-containing protein [Burkholderiales bacterium]
MGLNKDTVSLWRCRFLTAGVAGLQDRPRSGAPRKNGPELRERILAQLELAPPQGFGHWDGPLLATTLGVAAWRVWEILRIEGKAARMIKHAGRWILGLGESDSGFAVFERHYGQLKTA